MKGFNRSKVRDPEPVRITREEVLEEVESAPAPVSVEDDDFIEEVGFIHTPKFHYLACHS